MSDAVRQTWTCLVAVLAMMLAGTQGRAAETASREVLRTTLANGMRVVIVPNRLAPVVATQLNYLAGSNDAPEGFPGTAHALEHMMFRGSEGLGREQLADIGAQLGGDYNADTTETVTRYVFTVPAGDLGLALRAEALRMRGLTLAEADWRQERGAIEQEVSRDLSNPFYGYASQLQAILFQGTPYEHDALGTRPSFERTDAALLRRFYEQWYAPNNAILVIAGDVDPPSALEQVRAAFGDIPAGPLPSHRPVAAGPLRPQTLQIPTNFSMGLIGLAYRMPGMRDRDFAAADILSDVLGSERGPLYGLVPAGRALESQFSYQPKSDVGIGMALAAFPTGADPAPLLADVRRVIAEAADGAISPELVEASRRQELAQLAFANDSISGLASKWSRALAQRGLDSPDDLARAYAAVTVDDVKRLARRLLDPEQAVTAILTPRADGEQGASRGFGGTESFAAPPDHPVALPDWAAMALASLPQPPPTEPADVSVLGNGVRLIVQPEHVGHTVSVYGHIRQVPQVEEPPGKEGVASLADQLFGYGTQARDRLSFLKAVDDIAAAESAGASFSLRVLTPQFEAGIALLAENELHPALPEEAFAVVRRQLAQGVAGALRSPDHLFDRAIKSAIAPASDPILRQATPETISALTLADVRAYIRAAYRPDLTTIVVIGDVTSEQARRAIEAAFGGWQADGPTPAIDLPPLAANPASERRVPDASSLQDSVTLTQSVGLPVASPERYALKLGNAILGEGFSSRLVRDLRVRTGYVYSVSSDLEWSRTRATYAVTFGADAENVEKARQLIVQNIRAMQTAPVSETELVRAKAATLRRLAMGRESVDGIAGLYRYLTGLGLPLDAEQIAAARYAEITPQQIQAAFATWLRPDGLAMVVKGPPLAP